jgi:hypothetical protein
MYIILLQGLKRQGCVPDEGRCLGPAEHACG